MSFDYPDVEQFKSFFDRDFNYGTDLTTVRDADIENAFMEAKAQFRGSFFTTEERFDLAFLLLSAHTLCTTLTQSSQGISGSYSWLVNSRSVGSISEGMSIPQRILDNPQLAMLTKTTYGARYLALILPFLSGQVFTVRGATSAL